MLWDYAESRRTNSERRDFWVYYRYIVRIW